MGKQHILTLYMSIPGSLYDSQPSIEVFHEMLARTRSIKEVNKDGYFIGANGVYGKIELVDR